MRERFLTSMNSFAHRFSLCHHSLSSSHSAYTPPGKTNAASIHRQHGKPISVLPSDESRTTSRQRGKKPPSFSLDWRVFNKGDQSMWESEMRVKSPPWGIGNTGCGIPLRPQAFQPSCQPHQTDCTERYTLCYGVESSHRTPEVGADAHGWNAVISGCLLKRKPAVHLESKNRGMRW